MAPAISGLDHDPAEASLSDLSPSLRAPPAGSFSPCPSSGLSYTAHLSRLGTCSLALSSPSPAPGELSHVPHTWEEKAARRGAGGCQLMAPQLCCADHPEPAGCVLGPELFGTRSGKGGHVSVLTRGAEGSSGALPRTLRAASYGVPSLPLGLGCAHSVSPSPGPSQQAGIPPGASKGPRLWPRLPPPWPTQYREGSSYQTGTPHGSFQPPCPRGLLHVPSCCRWLEAYREGCWAL